MHPLFYLPFTLLPTLYLFQMCSSPLSSPPTPSCRDTLLSDLE